MPEPKWFPRAYDLAMAPLERFWLRPIRQRTFGTLHGKVLDIGIGTGANLGLYGLGTEVTAIDIDPGMLDRAI